MYITLRYIIAVLLVLFFNLNLPVMSVAQFNMADKLPLDPDVRIGRLPNGLTYYLRHNQQPAGLADFYILHHVGAIQEEDTQEGLAHFLEHMAFSGTKHFPGNSMIKWLESIGLQFGTNLNAATGMEMTYYMISQVPLRRESIIDSTLLILHDWSHFISLEEEEIDQERSIIIEELRQCNNASFRVGKKAAPYVYNKTRHAYRDLLGTEEQLRTFSSQALRDFYRRWYRPDLQAIMIVGDFDVDRMEQKVKEVMGSIPVPENPDPKEVIPIPDNKELIVAVISDPEQQIAKAHLYIKRFSIPVMLNDQIGTYLMNMTIGAAVGMTNRRLTEMAQQAGSPFSQARLNNTFLTASCDAFELQVTGRRGEIVAAFESAYTELERIKRYGFTEEEFEFMKINILRGEKQVYETSNNRSNQSFIWEYINHYSKNTPILSASHKWAVTQLLISRMTLDDINNLVKNLITPGNNVLVVTTPEREGVPLPTPQQMSDIMIRVQESELTSYQSITIDEPLISGNIKPGKIVKKHKGKYGSTVWVLKNGIEVVLMPTEYSRNQIDMSAVAQGGLSMISDQDYFTASMVGQIVNMSGVGNFSPVRLQKILGNRVASATPFISRFSTGITGRAAKSDVETMLQLTYLWFTQPRFDREKFDLFMEANRMNLVSSSELAEFLFGKEQNKAMYGEQFRSQFPTEEILSKIDFDKMQQIYNRFFGRSAGNYTFYFLGDIDLKTMRPLIEKYLGSLPPATEVSDWKDDGMRVSPGRIVHRFSAPMQTPKSHVSFNYTGNMDYTQENTLIMAMLSSCLQMRYIETIREEKGGTYTIQVNGVLERQPEPNYNLSISFQTDPGMVDELVEIVEEELQKIARYGPDPGDMIKNLEYWRKARPEGLKNNGAWSSFLQTWYTWHEDWNKDYNMVLKEVTADRVQKLAQKILDDGNVVRIIMDPESEK